MTTQEIKQLVVDYAYGCGINPNVALAQINRESGFDPGAIGSSGERGIAQFMPATWQRFGYGPHENAHDPNYALDAWCALMQYLLNRYGFNYRLALQGYNGGEGNVDRGTVSSAAREYARAILATAGTDDYGNPWPGGETVSPPILAGGPALDGQPGQTDWQTLALVGGAALAFVLILRG